MPSKVNTARIILMVLGWLQIVGAAIFFLIFLFTSVLIGTSGVEGATTGGAISSVVGLVFTIVFIAVGIVSLVTAKGIKEKKNWAKIVGIILGILSLPSIPIGTILGIFVLVGLIGEEADSWFGTAATPAQ